MHILHVLRQVYTSWGRTTRQAGVPRAVQRVGEAANASLRSLGRHLAIEAGVAVVAVLSGKLVRAAAQVARQPPPRHAVAR